MVVAGTKVRGTRVEKWGWLRELQEIESARLVLSWIQEILG